MKFKTKITLSTLAFIPLVSFSSLALAQSVYQMIEIPMSNEASETSIGFVMNNSGNVVTQEYDSSYSSTTQKLIWDSVGNYQEAPFHNLYDINNAGVATGSISGGGAIIYDNGVITPIPGAAGMEINDAKQVVIRSFSSNSDTSFYDDGVTVNLEQDVIDAIAYIPGQDVTYYRENVYGHGLNAAGEVVGRYIRYAETGSGALHTYLAFHWKDGVVTILEGLGGDKAAATDINDAGQIVGYVDKPSGGNTVVIWNNGVAHDIGVQPTNPFSTIDKDYRINNSGDVLGTNFLYKDGIYTLDNDLLTAEQKAAPFAQITLNDFNDAGDILATILYMDWPQGILYYRAVVLDPVPACQ